MTTSTVPSRQTNRLTNADIASVRGSIAVTMRTYPAGYVPTIAADFNALQRGAYRAARVNPIMLSDAELDEIADIIIASILNAVAR